LHRCGSQRSSLTIGARALLCLFIKARAQGLTALLSRHHSSLSARQSVCPCDPCTHQASSPRLSAARTILTLTSLAQRQQEYGRPTYSAYVDLRAAFDSLSRPALWLLLARCGIPQKLISLTRSLYSESTSCPRWKSAESVVPY